MDNGLTFSLGAPQPTNQYICIPVNAFIRRIGFTGVYTGFIHQL